MRAAYLAWFVAISLFAIGARAAVISRFQRKEQADTLFLDRNGKAINKPSHPGSAVTFIVHTTKTTNDLYGTSDSELHSDERGNASPIKRKDARRTEGLIKANKIREALATGNLIELRPSEERDSDWDEASKDNGKESDSLASYNNQEHGVTTRKDGKRDRYDGPVFDPCDTGAHGAHIDLVTFSDEVTNMHSHPSGTHKNCLFIQPPSHTDISKAPPGTVYWTVFGRGSDMVYLYNRSGVIAVLSVKRYVPKLR